MTRKFQQKEGLSCDFLAGGAWCNVLVSAGLVSSELLRATCGHPFSSSDDTSPADTRILHQAPPVRKSHDRPPFCWNFLVGTS